MGQYTVTTDLEHNKQIFFQIFADCADIKMVDMQLGTDRPLRCMVAYIEIVAAASSYGSSEIGRLIQTLSGNICFFDFFNLSDTVRRIDNEITRIKCVVF